MFETEELVRLAKRENNSKRSYLYVNPMQGKHIPVDPGKTKKMCKALADKIEKKYSDEKLFIIGFAETATAIASYVAWFLDNAIYFENTTREDTGKNEYLYFTESHSHATDQKLNINGFDNCLSDIERIVFVEDEVTTGNTICKLITELKKRYPQKLVRYSISSVLNSMYDKRIDELEEEGIDCIYLKKIPYEYKKESIDVFTNKEKCMFDCVGDLYEKSIDIHRVSEYINSRTVCKTEDYVKYTKFFCNYVYENEFCDTTAESVLVIGTEEFMYPAIELAEYLSEKGVCKEIKTHSTTRSPIMAYYAKDYPLNNRYRLMSVYDDDRITYIYNLKKYDRVIVVTDSRLTSYNGLKSLMSALKNVGNDNNISVYQWGSKK